MAGVGAVGRHHARVAAGLAGARCSGVFDKDLGRAQAVGGRHGLQVRRSLEELLDGSDGIVVAVPTRDHEAVATAAIRAGVHVLIEKPLAPDVAAGERIVAAGQRAGLVVQTGHVERFNPVFVAARPFLGRPLFVESHRLAPFAPRSLDVAVVLDLMIHDVDLLCALVRRPLTEVAAVGMPVLSPLVDIANARITFEGGAVANLTASRASVKRLRKLRVWQDSGYLSLDLAAGSGHFYRLRDGGGALAQALAEAGSSAGSLDRGMEAAAQAHPGAAGEELPTALASAVERIPLRTEPVEPLAAQQAAFRDALLGLAPPPVTGEDGLEALRIALAIEQQIEEHVAHTRSTRSQARVD